MERNFIQYFWNIIEYIRMVENIFVYVEEILMWVNNCKKCNYVLVYIIYRIDIGLIVQLS